MTYNKKYSRICRTVLLLGTTALSGLFSTAGHAAQLINNENYDLKWDTTLQYTLSLRVHSVNSKVAAQATQNNNDVAFNDGAPISSRVDVLTGIDFNLHDEHHLGFRVSAEGWYDSVYNGTHNSVPYSNAVGTPVNQFTHATTVNAGRDIKLLDAFVHGNGMVGDHPVTFRLGQHSVLWGESLFYASNAIAGGQSPVDILKAISKPQIQTKELILPVPQLSGSLGLTEKFTLAAYYQFGFRPDFLPPAGDYFALSDFLGAGAQRLIAVAPGTPHLPPAGLAFSQSPTQDGTNWHGQYGTALLYNNPDTDIDAGLYYIRYDNKSPTVVTSGSPFAGGHYTIINARDIEAYGASVSTTFGAFNVASEVSARRNQPLVSTNGNPGPANTYPAGDTIHANLSTIYSAPTSPLWDSLSVLGELAAQHLMTTTSQGGELGHGFARTAVAATAVISPTYFQALPHLDLSPSVGITYLFTNSSIIDPSFGKGHGGNASFGISGVYRTVWRGSVSYTHELGNAATNADIDRDFISFSVQRTF